jgi:alkanesulfonate monooxygenase SsuD/methylene tetrahydromethanopterin reductase-like flavin-dependent oxidoreductase (luciferase family)
MSPTTGMEFCLNFLQDEPLPRVLEWWRRCDRAGVQWVGLPDSPMIVRDWFVAAAYCASNTDRVKMMSAVTNAVTRDPSVMASALFSLDEIAPGRIACGISTGDSACWSVGLKPARVARVREYVLALKSLLRGEQVEFERRTLSPAWKNASLPARVPVYVACAGPRMLRTAAQVADGLIVFMGFSPERLEFVDRTIAEACAEVNRDPAELDVWWQTTINFGETVEAAMERSLGVNTSWMTMGSLDGKGIPDELREPLLRFNEDMEDVSTTYGDGEDRGAVLVRRAKELGLYDWLISMAPGLWGPPEAIARRLAEFRDRGMTRWQFYVAQFHGDRDVYLDRFLDGVLPALAARTPGTAAPPVQA